MIIYIIFLVATAAILVATLQENIRREKEFSRIRVEFFSQIFEDNVKPFSVSEYLDRMEQEAIEILKDETFSEYEITLWWGLDGLRMNRDGSSEWVSRTQKFKPEPTSENAAPLLCGMLKSTPIYYPMDVLNYNIQYLLQNCIIQPPQDLSYAPYYCAGSMQSCCNWIR